MTSRIGPIIMWCMNLHVRLQKYSGCRFSNASETSVLEELLNVLNSIDLTLVESWRTKRNEASLDCSV
jgi:hypothetical protein